MKINLLLLLFLLIYSCGQDYNSNSFDDLIYADSSCSGSAADIRFCQSFNIIKDRCISCHTGWHNSFATFTDTQSWIDAGLIVPNDASASLLMTRIRGYGVTPSANMPPNGSEISKAERDALEAWIDGL